MKTLIFCKEKWQIGLLQRLDANTNDAKMILELGCGTGRMIPSLQRKFAKGRLFALI